MNASPAGASAEQLVLHLLLQLVAILVATRLVSAARRLTRAQQRPVRLYGESEAA